MSGRVTMVGISRWGGKGGSYRTIQRFFYSPKNWPTRFVGVQKHPLLLSPRKVRELLAAALALPQEMKWSQPSAGHQTYGMDWFFSSLAQRPVKGLAFFALSLVSLEQRQSYPLRIEQVIRPVPEAKAAPPPSSSGTFG